MGAKFVNVDRDTALLLPPDMREWVPEDHLVHFIVAAVEQLDLSVARVNERGTGSEQYPPSLLLALLIYSYATGAFSSRQIERATYDSVAVRVLCADTHPDHDTLCTFRRQNAALLAAAFAQVLELAAHCGVLKVAGITVAIDGTKVLANASKHAATSYARAGETMRQLELEVAELLAKAEQADATPLQDGLTLPDEVARRQARKAKLAQARAAIEARAYARAMAEQAARAPDEPGPPPPAPPAPKAQINFTDPDSAIMKAGSGQHFEQSYNAQAALEVDRRLFVATRVTRAGSNLSTPSAFNPHPAAHPAAASKLARRFIRVPVLLLPRLFPSWRAARGRTLADAWTSLSYLEIAFVHSVSEITLRSSDNARPASSAARLS